MYESCRTRPPSPQRRQIQFMLRFGPLERRACECPVLARPKCPPSGTSAGRHPRGCTVSLPRPGPAGKAGHAAPQTQATPHHGRDRPARCRGRRQRFGQRACPASPRRRMRPQPAPAPRPPVQLRPSTHPSRGGFGPSPRPPSWAPWRGVHPPPLRANTTAATRRVAVQPARMTASRAEGTPRPRRGNGSCWHSGSESPVEVAPSAKPQHDSG